MPRKKTTVNDLPYLNLTMFTKGDLLLAVRSKEQQTPAPLAKTFGASMKVTIGADRMALATTLVEVARDLVKDCHYINDWLSGAAREMVKEQLSSGDFYVVQAPEDLPF